MPSCQRRYKKYNQPLNNGSSDEEIKTNTENNLTYWGRLLCAAKPAARDYVAHSHNFPTLNDC